MRTWGSLALQRAHDNIGACPTPYAHAGGIGDAPGTACSPGPRRNSPAPTGSCAWCGAGARELRRGGAVWRGRRGVECARGWLADSDPHATCGGMGRLPMRGARHWCPFDAPHAACTRKRAHFVIHTPPQHQPRRPWLRRGTAGGAARRGPAPGGGPARGGKAQAAQPCQALCFGEVLPLRATGKSGEVGARACAIFTGPRNGPACRRAPPAAARLGGRAWTRRPA
jgi:hypothetical protein